MLDHTATKILETDPYQNFSDILSEPRHEKTCLCHMRTTKAQICLHILVVWAAPAWIVQYLYLLQLKFQDSS